MSDMQVLSGPTIKAPAGRFTGDGYLSPFQGPDAPARMYGGLIRFAPSARTNWHSHAMGQILYITDGVGLVGTRDGDVERVIAGQTVVCPPGEEHWHGATDGTFMAHIALNVNIGDGDGVTWLEPVTDEQYQAAIAAFNQ
jgi:quercetin dioxygenase-like cupin family protein